MKQTVRRKCMNALSTFSLILFPVTFYYLSPALPVYGGLEGIVTGSLVVFFLLFLFSMVMGRVFCSWFCPAGKIQELTEKTNNRRLPVNVVRWIKYAVWAPWLVVLFFIFRRAGEFQGLEFLKFTRYGLSATDLQGIVTYTIVVLVFFLISLITGRRAACHTICWISPFMILGKKAGGALHLPSLKLKANTDSCVDCGRCTDVCPMSLDVRNMVKDGGVDHTECILCGSCVDTCPAKTLSFTWRKV